MSLVEVKVPDIGDFSDVPVIELFVKVGDTIKVDDAIATLESDKATMDVPSSAAGVIKEVKVALGDRVGEGKVLIVVEADGAGASPAPAAAAAPAPAPAAAAVAAPAAASHGGAADVEYDLVVLGAGPGGYSAAFRAADLGLKTVLVERYPTLGGVCLNVGCIPSKALLHASEMFETARHGLGDLGVVLDTPPKLDLPRMMAHKDATVASNVGGVSFLFKKNKIDWLKGTGRLLGGGKVAVTAADGSVTEVESKSIVLATGSEVAGIPGVGVEIDEKVIVSSTGALSLAKVPQHLVVVGGGVIGLELGSVWARLGARVTVVE
ncbi:MAG: FAD-dependent oxidoreductase, partial [Proteobacteria bacterium]|nr:FAD-dependent oxidoreductase [Pseudomonadota bacterium]